MLSKELGVKDNWIEVGDVRTERFDPTREGLLKALEVAKGKPLRVHLSTGEYIPLD